MIKLQQILEEIAADNSRLLTNKNVVRIIQSRSFFSNLRILTCVLEPLRKAVLALEARSATLADCFLSLARLAAVLNKLSESFNPSFHNHCAKVINRRCNGKTTLCRHKTLLNTIYILIVVKITLNRIQMINEK